MDQATIIAFVTIPMVTTGSLLYWAIYQVHRDLRELLRTLGEIRDKQA